MNTSPNVYIDKDGFLDVPAIIRDNKLDEYFLGLISNMQELRSKEFPLLEELERVYLDNGATTQEPKSVIDRIYEYRTKNLRGSNHSENSDEAESAQQGFEEARAKLKDFFHAQQYFIAFTSGTTGASNLLATRFLFEPGDLLLITDMEHNSQVLSVRNIAEECSVDVGYVPCVYPEGRLDMDALEKMVSERESGRILLMLAHVSNVTGVINPVGEIREKFGDQVLIYLDIAQSAGHLPIDLDSLDVDFAGVSAHKMYGPMGMGAFFVHKRNDALLGNTISGGSAVKLVSKENVCYEESPTRFEPGTQNLEGAFEWGYAIDFLSDIGMEAIEAHDRALGEYFIEELQKIQGVQIRGPIDFQDRIAVVTFTIGKSNTNYEEVARELNKHGISVRDGCFCAHLLMYQILDVEEEVYNGKITKLLNGADFKSMEKDGAVRAAFAFYNTPMDAYKAVMDIRGIASFL